MRVSPNVGRITQSIMASASVGAGSVKTKPLVAKTSAAALRATDAGARSDAELVAAALIGGGLLAHPRAIDVLVSWAALGDRIGVKSVRTPSAESQRRFGGRGRGRG